MPGRSKFSVALSGIQRQLKSGKTRGISPRDLTEQEVNALLPMRETLPAQLKDARQQRVLDRINGHTTAESAETRAHVSTEAQATRAHIQPLVDLVATNAEATPKERIKARQNQIALLLAATRLDATKPQPKAAPSGSPKPQAKRKAPSSRSGSSKRQRAPFCEVIMIKGPRKGEPCNRSSCHMHTIGGQRTLVDVLGHQVPAHQAEPELAISAAQVAAPIDLEELLGEQKVPAEGSDEAVKGSEKASSSGTDSEDSEDSEKGPDSEEETAAQPPAAPPAEVAPAAPPAEVAPAPVVRI